MRSVALSAAKGLAVLLLLLAGCAAPGPLRKVWPFGKKGPLVKSVARNYSGDKLDNLGVTQELIGVGGAGKWSTVLKGFLKGKVVYRETGPDGGETEKPAEGFFVYVDAPEFPQAAVPTNPDGEYKIPFQIQIMRDRAASEGKIRLNPDWRHILDVKGVSYQAPFSDVPFQIAYNGEVGWAILVTQLPRKLVVERIRSDEYRRKEDFYRRQEEARRQEEEEKKKKKQEGKTGGFPGFGGGGLEEGFPGFP